MNAVYRVIGAIAHNLIERIAPLQVHERSYLAVLAPAAGADRLADAEADVDTWEPALADWERELRDAFILPDDMTLDQYVESDPQLFCDCDSQNTNQLAGVGKPTPPNGDDDAGESPVTDQIATVIAVVLRGQGINSAAIYADLVARELRHHFFIFRK